MRLLPQIALKEFTEGTKICLPDGNVIPGIDLTKNAFMVCTRGSVSYGTNTVNSDEDYFVVVIPPLNRLVGLYQWDQEEFIVDDIDVKAVSLQTYFKLLAKNNPNVIETLWLRGDDYCPIDTHRDFMWLQVQRDIFSSMLSYHSFGGYARSQLRKITNVDENSTRKLGAKRKAIIKQFGYDTANASHVIRLFRMGIEFVESGRLTVRRPDRLELLDIKQGKLSLEEVKAMGMNLEELLALSKAKSVLPKFPDLAKINEILVDLTQKKLLDKLR